MNDLLIPGWAVYLMAGFIFWMVWLTLQTLSNKQAIAVNNTNDANVGNAIKDINQSIQTLTTDTKQGFEKINGRLDVFMGNEIQLLKGLIK